jgi:hypothetical protein
MYSIIASDFVAIMLSYNQKKTHIEEKKKKNINDVDNCIRTIEFFKSRIDK